MKSIATLQAEIAEQRAKTSEDVGWYLIHCHARSDQRARDQLLAMGWLVFMPQLRRMKAPPRDKLSRKQREQIANFRRPVIEPLFPRYLFLHMSVERDPWRDVFRAVGVSGLACDADDMPMAMPAGFVEGIKAAMRDGALPHNTLVAELMRALCKSNHLLQEQAVQRVQKGEAPFALGEIVRITEGPFASFSGPIEQLPADLEVGDLDESARVTVLAAFFGRSVPVQLELGQIRKMD